MPKIFLSSQHDYVFGLGNSEFNNLCLEVENRKCVDRFVYLFRCKQQDETWPRDERILRHILLADVELKRSDLESKREKARKIIKH